jgi:hypothetical protein
MLKYFELFKQYKNELTWFFKIVFSLLLIYLLYYQLDAKISSTTSLYYLFQSFSLLSYFFLFLVFVLMILNWGLESYKWKLLVNRIQDYSFFKSFQSVLAGLSISMFTPNRTGEFLGRMFFIKEELRLKSITLSVAGSMAQWSATLFFGSLSLLAALKYNLIKIDSFFLLLFLVALLISCILSLLILYHPNLILHFTRNTRINYWIQKVTVRKIPNSFMNSLVLISLFRYLIFVLQFYLLLLIFKTDISVFKLVILIPCIFTAITLLPTFAFSEIGIRGNVALFFLSSYSQNSLGIVSAALLIWVINLLIPSLIGGLFILNLKSKQQ